MALHAIITMVLREMAAWLSNFTSKKIVTVAHQKDTGNGTHPDLGELARGDIVAYYDSSGNIMHTQTCTGNGTANNEPLSYPGRPDNQSWKWATSPAGDWANNLYWPDWNTEGNDPTPVIIKVYIKP